MKILKKTETNTPFKNLHKHSFAIGNILSKTHSSDKKEKAVEMDVTYASVSKKPNIEKDSSDPSRITVTKTASPNPSKQVKILKTENQKLKDEITRLNLKLKSAENITVEQAMHNQNNPGMARITRAATNVNAVQVLNIGGKESQDRYSTQDLSAEGDEIKVDWTLLKSVNSRKKKKDSGISVTSEGELDNEFMSASKLNLFLKERIDQITETFGQSSAASLLALWGIDMGKSTKEEDLLTAG